MIENQPPTAVKRAPNRSQSRKAREIALKALYEGDTAKHNPQHSIERLLKQEANSRGQRELARNLIHGVMTNLEYIDVVIGELAPTWPVKQISAVDRNVLRIAIYEIQHGQSTPPKVAINEAIELAKTYGAANSPQFVNGALGELMRRQSAPTTLERGN